MLIVWSHSVLVFRAKLRLPDGRERAAWRSLAVKVAVVIVMVGFVCRQILIGKMLY